MLNRKGNTEIKIRPPYARSPFRETVAAPNLFSDPADWMVQEAAARLVDESIIEDRVVRLSPTGNVAVVPFSQSHYANLPVPLSTESEVSDLSTALVVDETHRPLTIAAANAVSAASMQDYDTVMARIDTVHLESIVTRMIGLPDAAYPLVNLGNSVVLNDQVTPIEQTCWRLDLRPLWARHLYFTVRLADADSR